MLITPHFTLEEFTHTDHRNVDNTLPRELYGNMKQTLEMMERIRAFLCEYFQTIVPISLSSGYRCPELNTLVGSGPTSDHLAAFAVDWKPMLPSSNLYTVAKILANKVDELKIGQLIYEYGRWIHCGVPVPRNPVNRVITISKAGTRQGIQPV